MTLRFWETTPLTKLNDEQWESLCDTCGRCCVHKFQDEDTEELLFTNVACRLLNCDTCFCTDYANRASEVPGCIKVSLEMLEDDTQREWLPSTCAYRLLAEDKPLKQWHPLLTGSDEAIIEAGVKLAGTLIPEGDADLQALEDSL